MRNWSSVVVTRSARETQRLSRALLKRGVRIFALVGELGAGKTAFSQGLARALGIRRRITSPTFIIFNKYRVPKRITQLPNYLITDFYHIDLYRIRRPSELKPLHLKEIFRKKNAVVAVEWAEKARRMVPGSAVWIEFRHGKTPHERIIAIK